MTANNSNYTFAFSFLQVTDPNAGIQVWQSGTLTLNVADPSSVSGSLSLPGFYKEPIPFEGTATDSFGTTGTLVNASGASSEAEGTFAFIFNYDGFLFNGSLLGGMAQVLDNSAQETFLYIMQGFSPQEPS